MDKVNITISKKNWKKMAKLKIDKDLKSFDEVIEHLFKDNIEISIMYPKKTQLKTRFEVIDKLKEIKDIK
jgi:hypothetical protein